MLFITFVLLFLGTLTIFGGTVYIFKNKIVTLRDFVSSIVFMSCLSILYFTVTTSIDVNNKLFTQFKISKDFYTDVDSQDSIINDTILYNYLLEMRVPHAKIMFCQAKLESNSYRSEIFQTNKNMFGMKVATKRTTVSINNNRGYQSYCNWRESVTDYVLWSFSNKLDQLSDYEYLIYLSKVYAEDSNYTEKLNKMLTSIDFKKFIK